MFLGLGVNLVARFMGGISSPSQLTGLTVWLKAENYNAGTKTWTDSSGKGNDATTAGTAPTVNASFQNSLPGVVFNGTSMSLATGSIDLTASTGATVFVVTNDSVNATACCIYEFTSNANNANGFALFVNSTKLDWNAGTPANSVESTGAVSRNPTTIITGVWDRTAAASGGPACTVRRAAKTSVAVTQQASGVLTGGLANAPLYIGARGAASLFYPGTIGEIVLYSRALSQTEYVAIENYLSSRWAIP